MANQAFQRTPGRGKFAYLGIDLKNPPDLMRPGRTPYLLNVSPDEQQGALVARAGLSPIGFVPGTPHSVRRVNNSFPNNATWQRFIGSGTNLYTGQTVFNLIDSGYSGNPLSLVPYRPPMSPETWLYAFDSLKQAKYRTDGVTKQNIGILPPTQPPTTSIGTPVYKAVLDVASATGWNSTPATTALPTVASRVNTTVSSILYDVGTTGWACLTLANTTALGVGARLTVDSEIQTISQVFASLPSTTVAGVVYDSGTSGMATVVPGVAMQGLQRNMLAVVNGTNTRILSVTEGPNNGYSFRCVLPAGVATGQTIAIPASLRMYFASTHASSATVSSSAFSAATTAPAGVTSLNGLTYSLVTLDLSQINGRPVTVDDYMHVSFNVDNPANVQEVHFLLDVDSTTNDFTRNYYYYAVRQSDFQQAATGTATTLSASLTALSNQLANDNTSAQTFAFGQVPYPGNTLGQFDGAGSTDQFPPGSSQWFDAMFRINDLTRVGSDPSVNLSQVKAIGMLVILTGSATASFGSWWIGGTYGPDSNMNSYGNAGQPILYRYRYRSSLSGAYSDVSPATRNGDIPWRQPIALSVTASTDPQVDYIDVERNGGTGDSWHRCLILPNTTTTMLDTVVETVAQAGDPLELLSYAPWPVTDKPRTGLCNIIGTRVTQLSGDTFNLNWIRGVEFLVANQTYTLYAPPDSATTLQLSENVGVLLGVVFLIPEATIIGFPLPYVTLGMDGRLFGSGDPYNPGLLYFTNPYAPDAASDRGYIEVSSPSEPIGMPVFYEGAIYVHTASDVYRVDSTPSSVNGYTSYKLGGVAGSSGVWSVSGDGPILAWLGTDGIYGYGGQNSAENLTNEDLYPLFPFESRPGLPVAVSGNTLYPPDYTKNSQLRLSSADGFLFFDYVDTTGATNTLAYNLRSKSWNPYTYSPGAVLHYQEEGVPNPVTLVLGTTGAVSYLSGAANDLGTPFNCVVVTPADDAGETRARKQYGDLMIDYAGSASATIYYDTFLLAGASTSLATAARRTQVILDLGVDNVSLHRNIGIVASWSSASLTSLFEWQPSLLVKPEDSSNRPTDWLDAGTMHYKFVHGCRITADTGGTSRTVQVQYDGGLIGPTLTVNHALEMALPYSFPPFKAHLMRLVPTDGLSWRLMNVEWEVDEEPEPTGFWVTQPTSFGMPGYLHIRDFEIAYASLSSASIITLVVDGNSYLIAQLGSTNGMEVKQYFAAPPIKGKLWQIYGTGTGLQIYQQDCEFRVKSWGAQQYSVLKPYGDVTVTSGGARI